MDRNERKQNRSKKLIILFANDKAFKYYQGVLIKKTTAP